MSWEPELEELRRRRALAQRMGGEERVARQRTAGKLTVRERIERLLDPGSFHETGELAGAARYDETGGPATNSCPVPRTMTEKCDATTRAAPRPATGPSAAATTGTMPRLATAISMPGRKGT